MIPDNQFYVYVLFRPWNGKPFYIGKGKGRRWLTHERRYRKLKNRYIAAIYKKAASLGLEVPKVKIREGLSEKDAFSVESALIAVIGRGPGKMLANLTDGGEGTAGRQWTESAREKQRAAMMGNKRSLGYRHSEDTRKLLSLAKINPSLEVRMKISAAHAGKRLSVEHRAKLSTSHIGKKLSQEHKNNIGAVQRGRKRPKETLERMSIAQIKNRDLMSAIIRERWKDPAHRAKVSAAWKKKRES